MALSVQENKLRPFTINLSKIENLSIVNSLQHCLTHDVIFPKEIPVLSLCWSYCCAINALAHSLNGNRRFGYRIGFWNCRKKLISSNSFDTNKLTDIKAYFARNNQYIF